MDPSSVRCLVVDDEPRLRGVLVRVLEAVGYGCVEAGSGAEAVAALEAEEFPIVLTDIRMPVMDGITLLREIRRRWPDVSVVMLTAVAEVETAVACLQMGAFDYVAKPFQVEEVRARVAQALDKRRLVLENGKYQLNLADMVRAQAVRIEELFLEGVQTLVHALEAKDPYTRGHSARVTDYAGRTARLLGLDDGEIQVLELGAELHDIGKIGVREEVLRKPSALSDAEYEHIMSHTVIGARILEPLLKNAPQALGIVRSHHERYDGNGWPDKLRGDAIPYYARIVAVVDSFDAMTSGRPYRPARLVDTAMTELKEGRGIQWDGGVVEAFFKACESLPELPLPTPLAIRRRIPGAVAAGAYPAQAS